MNVSSLEELQAKVEASQKCGGVLIPLMGQSKLRGVADDPNALFCQMDRSLIHYDPNEFTVTVGAGIPIRELQSVLSENRQYLPFDPMFGTHGATLGGTVAAGSNGSCCLRYGSIRDFILGVEFIDGSGNLIRSGGNVVKNAAGFDLSKFFVGSAGRFGILTKISLKVFPMPNHFLTIKLKPSATHPPVDLLDRVQKTGIEVEALDLTQNGEWMIRLGGEESVLENSGSRIQSAIQDLGEIEKLTGDQETKIWRSLGETEWADSQNPILKLPITPREIKSWQEWLIANEISHHFRLAGNSLLINCPQPQVDNLEQRLHSEGRCGQWLRHSQALKTLGSNRQLPFLNRIKRALDPQNVYGKLES